MDQMGLKNEKKVRKSHDTLPENEFRLIFPAEKVHTRTTRTECASVAVQPSVYTKPTNNCCYAVAV